MHNEWYDPRIWSEDRAPLVMALGEQYLRKFCDALPAGYTITSERADYGRLRGIAISAPKPFGAGCPVRAMVTFDKALNMGPDEAARALLEMLRTPETERGDAQLTIDGLRDAMEGRR